MLTLQHVEISEYNKNNATFVNYKTHFAIDFFEGKYMMDHFKNLKTYNGSVAVKCKFFYILKCKIF